MKYKKKQIKCMLDQNDERRLAYIMAEYNIDNYSLMIRKITLDYIKGWFEKNPEHKKRLDKEHGNLPNGSTRPKSRKKNTRQKAKV